MRESRLFIILISLVMGLAGCSKETMIGEYVDRCAVRLDIDWGPCGPVADRSWWCVPEW